MRRAQGRSWRDGVRSGLAGLLLTLALGGCAGPDGPAVVGLPGRPALVLGEYDLGSVGYTAEEFFVSGRAASYKLVGVAGPDGRWAAEAAGTAPYATRVVVVRPSDPRKFNGSVVVEWLNVSAGADGAVAWSAMHRELIRDGFAYVGVSAQRAGVEGAVRQGIADLPLKAVDPQRYGRLHHPGDAFAFDIFTQAGRLLRRSDGGGLLGPLAAKRLIAVGDAQSAMFLTTYANAVDPLARIYDGFMINSRSGPAAPLDGAWPYAPPSGAWPSAVRLRADLRAPVMSVVTETDLVDAGRFAGFRAARQPDSDRLRVWEIAGASHVDSYLLRGGRIDSGHAPLPQLAAAYAPTDTVLGMTVAKPVNSGFQHHYVLEAALWQLDRWIRTGEAPPRVAPILLSTGPRPQPVRDVNGEARGGVRTPWVDAPVARLAGTGNAGGPLGFLLGVGEPFDAATLDRLYPGGRRDYLGKFSTSLDDAVRSGVVLPADRPEILQLASAGWRGAR